MVFIVVRTQVEGIHQYDEAPSEVSFLGYPHRHQFHVEVEMEVLHDNRELEFIMVKDFIDLRLQELMNPASHTLPSLPTGSLWVAFNNHTFSCEMLARAIQYLCKQMYGRDRKVHVKVFEDGENGVHLVDRT